MKLNSNFIVVCLIVLSTLWLIIVIPFTVKNAKIANNCNDVDVDGQTNATTKAPTLKFTTPAPLMERECNVMGVDNTDQFKKSEFTVLEKKCIVNIATLNDEVVIVRLNLAKKDRVGYSELEPFEHDPEQCPTLGKAGDTKYKLQQYNSIYEDALDYTLADDERKRRDEITKRKKRQSSRKQENNLSRKPRIVSGEHTETNVSPWIVAIMYGTKSRNRKVYLTEHRCGGSIISSSWVITTKSHCVDVEVEPRHYTILAGSPSTTDTEISTSFVTSLKAIIRRNNEYEMGLIRNEYNIALLKLTDPIPIWTDYIQPICIQDTTLNLETDNDVLNPWKIAMGDLQASGYGHRSVEEQIMSLYTPELYKIDLEPLSLAYCSSIYNEGISEGLSDALEEHDVSYFGDLFVCAGADDSGVCINDQGGPLSIQKNGVTYLLGVTVWQSDWSTENWCSSQKEKPSIFANINYHQEWIHSTVHHYDNLLQAFYKPTLVK